MRKEWFWCLHCERAFQADVPDDYERGWFLGSIGIEKVHPAGYIYYECPYDGCDGQPIDFFDWEYMREDDNNFPETPTVGVVYSPRYDAWEVDA